MTVRQDPAGDLRRREFIGVCASLAALPIFAACASVLVRQVPLTNGRIELALAQYPELREAGASLQILPEGEQQPLVVLVGEDGSHTVLSTECTHRGCTVEAQPDRLECPCHGSTYSRTGVVLKGPAEQPLRRYRSQLRNDGVLVIQLAS
jgi:Rieske Fe-S protein